MDFQEITLLIAKIAYLFLPAGIANMSPILFKWIPFGKMPIDFGAKIKGKRILGDHKTLRGLISGTLAAIIVLLIQKKFAPYTSPINFIDYQKINPIVLGIFLGFGALAGDMIKSFFKRHFNIKPGKSWVPFDQIDWIVGAAFGSWLYLKIAFPHLLIAIIIFGLLHPLTNLIGYFLKIKKNKF